MRSFSTSRKIARRRGERGAALLFAIGILAMLMMLGLGFVTNALIANRIAFNNSRRSQARTIARAAVAQAMTQIMLYVDQANDPNDIPAASGGDAARTLYDFSAIRSWGDTVAVNQAASPSNETNLTDQLSGTGNKFTYDYDTTVGNYNFASNNDVSWVFFYDDANSSYKKIVGRAAWQVLPRHTRPGTPSTVDDESRLSLYKMLAGAVGTAYTSGSFVESTGGLSDQDPDVLLSERKQVPWLHRWGRGVEEMFLDFSGSVFHKWIENEDNSAEAPPYTFDMLFSAYHDYFGSTAATNSLRKAWIRKWFSEGDQRLAKEAYAADLGSGSYVYHHRFNLGDKTDGDFSTDDALKWYDRFPSGAAEAGKRNSGDILKELAAPAEVYMERDDVDDKTNYYSGLPFLTRLGNDKWSFDTIENFRKQIAANLNDYCDADDVPTSDITPKASGEADWSISDTTKFPKYTGNEKTSYINEFAWVFDLLQLKFRKPADGSKFTDFPVSASFDASTPATAAMFAELVNIYNADPASAAYTLTARLENLDFRFSTTIKYSMELAVTYTNADDSPGTATANATRDISGSQYVSKPSSGDTEVSITFDAAANGYRIKGAKTSQNLTPTISSSIGWPNVKPLLNSVCASAAQSVVPTGGSLVSWSITSVKIAVQVVPTSTSFAMSPLMLSCNGKPVDFANFSTTAVGTLTIDTASHGDTKNLKIDTSAAEPKLPLRFVLAGFEVVDPRQNLNPKVSGNSDWLLKPTLYAAKIGSDSPASATDGTVPDDLSDATKIPSMTFAPAATDITAVFTEGKVNTCGNPSSGQIVVDNVLTADAAHDTETATDPAWHNDGEGKPVFISTAAIRNAPMKSLWELGAIHRARPWQTLNLTGASNFIASGGTAADIAASNMISTNFSADGTNPKWDNAAGTDYTKGDGGILDMVKLSNACRAWGKLDFTLLTTAKINADNAAFSGMGALDETLIKALFNKINRGQSLQDFIDGSAAFTLTPETVVTADAISDAELTAAVTKFKTAVDSKAAARLRSELLNTGYGKSDNTCALALVDDDAGREEIIGKTIGLLAANGRTIPNVFRVLVIAQSIDDAGSFGTADPIPIVKKDSGGNTHTIECRQGVFNYCSGTDQSGNSYNLYFDRITGEVKLVATVERDPKTGSMKIRQLEYLD